MASSNLPVILRFIYTKASNQISYTYTLNIVILNLKFVNMLIL